MEGGALEQAVAVLPVAAVEQHGPHLPLGVDVQIMEHALAAVLRALPETAPVVLLPVQAVGVSPEHGAFAGTLTLPAILAAQVWTAIAEGVAAAGCRRLVLLSSHGGNMPTLDIVAQDLRARLGMVCVTTAFARFGLPPGLAEAGHDWHGGLAETAVMLAARPDGRRYLSLVVLVGLIGPLQVEGASYRNVMPAQSGLDAADVAAVLNHVGAQISHDGPAFRPFTATEVAGYAADKATITASDLAALHARLEP